MKQTLQAEGQRLKSCMSLYVLAKHTSDSALLRDEQRRCSRLGGIAAVVQKAVSVYQR